MKYQLEQFPAKRFVVAELLEQFSVACEQFRLHMEGSARIYSVGGLGSVPEQFCAQLVLG